eukprot:737673-Amphidinium_carterae.1
MRPLLPVRASSVTYPTPCATSLALLQPNHIRMAVHSARVKPTTSDARSLIVLETSQVGLIWRIAKMKTLKAGGTAWDEITVEDPMIVAEKRQAPPAVEPGLHCKP